VIFKLFFFCYFNDINEFIKVFKLFFRCLNVKVKRLVENEIF